MKALSIRQPWAWAILHSGKRIENREWRGPPRSMIGETFLLHAAKGCTFAEYNDARSFMHPPPPHGPGVSKATVPAPNDLPRGAIVGRARLAETVLTTHEKHRLTPGTSSPCLLCGDVAVPYMDRRAFREWCPKPDPWAVPGALGLVLADVERLVEPVPFKGALGFFGVPDALLVGARWERVEEVARG